MKKKKLTQSERKDLQRALKYIYRAEESIQERLGDWDEYPATSQHHHPNFELSKVRFQLDELYHETEGKIDTDLMEER